jgi:hypothetical protein
MNDAHCTFESVLVIVAAITEHKGTDCVGAVITIARAELRAREARGQAVTDSALRAVLVSAIEMCEISHLIAVCETIPWCRAADRGNYGRYLPGYINDMITLQEKQPKSYQYLQDGGFVVRRSCRCFNAVASDQALKQTINGKP